MAVMLSCHQHHACDSRHHPRTIHAWTAAPAIPSSLNDAATSITPINASLAARGSVGGRARGVASSPSSSLSLPPPPPTVLASLTSAWPSDERRRLSGGTLPSPLPALGWIWADILQAWWGAPPRQCARRNASIRGKAVGEKSVPSKSAGFSIFHSTRHRRGEGGSGSLAALCYSIP